MKRDDGTEIAQDFLERSLEIRTFLNDLPFSQQQKKLNLYKFNKKQEHKKWDKLFKYPKKLYWKLLRKPYRHKNRFDFTEYNLNAVKGVYLKLDLQ